MAWPETNTVAGRIQNGYSYSPHFLTELPMPKKKTPLPVVMFNLIAGRWVTQIIHVAAKLQIADRLKDGPRTVDELASSAGAQPQPLYRVLRALASYGIFEETKGRRFKLTPLAATLRGDIPGSMRAFAVMNGSKYQAESWQQLLQSVETGAPPFRGAHGMSYFEYLEKHPDDLKIFSEAMTNLSITENPAITLAYKFSGVRTLVDVGGGNGSLLRAILEANPGLKAVLFDRPSVSATAREGVYLTAKSFVERCRFEGGNFFDAVPKGGDAYVMKRVLHDWSDEDSAKILANCRAAMNRKGKVLVVESLIRPGNAPDRGKLLDLQMFAIGGRERTKQDFAAVFKKAGLRLTRVIRTSCPLSIVEGVKA
jgi:O-methyltransferase/methyltransferase family protein